MSADVAILIVTFNSEGQIEPCLRSVQEQRQSVDQQVIVLDNDSKDGTVALVREKFPWVQLVTPGRNLGFAAGVNLAARHADADFILLLNPDTEIVDHAIDRVVAFARGNPRHGFYGGRTLRPDGTLEPSSCWGQPTLWSMAMFAAGLTTVAKRNPWLDPESLGNWQRDTIREVGVITGCFLLAATDAWRRLGGFDERYFMYGEDTDLARRAWAAGYRPVIFPEARLIHEVGQSSSTPLHKARLLYRGKACYIRTHWTGLRQNFGLGLLWLGVGARALLSAALGRSGGTWSGLWRERGAWMPGYPRETGSTAVAAVESRS